VLHLQQAIVPVETQFMESSQLLSHMQQKIAPVETPVQGTPPKSGSEGLTKAFATVISE